MDRVGLGCGGIIREHALRATASRGYLTAFRFDPRNGRRGLDCFCWH